jgi:hypothetical protein
MRRWIVLVLICVWSGCGTVPLSHTQRASLRSVSIDPNVEMPAPDAPNRGFYLYGTPAASLRSLLDEHEIDPVAILRDAFAEQLRAVHGLPPLQEERGDAIFHLKVLQYGIENAGTANPWRVITNSPPLKPLLSVNASLTLPDGKVIWTGRAHITNMSTKQDSHLLKELVDDPELAREALAKATALVSKELVETLAEQR